MSKKKSSSELDSIQQTQFMFNESEKLAGVGSWVWDIKADVWTFSDNWLKIHGIRIHNLSSTELLSIAHPDDTEKIRKALDDATNKHTAYKIEHRIIKKDTGEIRHIKAFGKVIETKNKKAQKLVGAALDVTDHKHLENELTDLVERFELATKSASIGIWDVDLNTNKLFWDNSMYKQYDAKPEEFESAYETWRSCIHPEDVERVDKEVGIAIESKTSLELEYRIITPKKKTKFVKVFANIARNKANKATRLTGISFDTTKQKETELQLIKAKEKAQENEAKYQAMYDNTPAGMFRSTPEGKILSANPSFFKIYGFNNLMDLENYSAKEFYTNKHDRAKMLQALKKEGAIKNFITKEFKKDKTEIWVKCDYSAVKNKKGEILFIDGVLEDITDNIVKENALKQSEEKFKGFFNSNPSAVFVWEKTGNDFKLIEINNSALLNTNNKAKDFIGLKASEIYADLPYLEEKLNRCYTGQSIIEFEDHYLSRYNNTYDWVSFRMAYSKPNLIILFADIINEKKKVEQDLLSQNERLNSLTKILQNKFASQVEMLDYTLEQAIKLTQSKIGYIYYYNQKKKQFTLNTWSGNVMKECAVVNPQTIYDLDSTGCWGEAVRQRKPYMNNNYSTGGKFEKGTPEGHIQLKKFLTVPIFEGKEIKAVIGVANKETDYLSEDIDQLTLLMNAVWKIVEQNRYQNELKVAKEKAEESDRLKTEFLNNMSHEIRTPLNGILGFSKLLCKENITPEKKNAYSEIIASGGKRLTRVIEDIVDMSMIESNQLEIIKSEFNLGEFLSNIKLKYTHDKLLLSKKNLAIKFNHQLNHSIPINTDKIRLNQVIDNLITNSIKYSEQGTIEIGSKLDDNSFEFYVKDEGMGIPDEQKHKLFQRFTHIESEKIREGTGIGLAISKGIIELLGGTIWHKDNMPQGSVFSFSIPLNKKNKVSALEPGVNDIAAKQPLKNKLLYIAEDDQVSTEYLSEILSETEFTYKMATNGKELLKLMEKKVPDLILLDIKMPILDGYETLKIIKSKYPKINVIAQTAHAMDNEKARIMSAGFDGYIAKPIIQEELLKLIKKHLSK